MIEPPLTAHNAKLRKYGSERTVPFNGNKCAYEVHTPGTVSWRQCSRRPHHGPGQLYCFVHAERVERERRTS